MAEEIRVRFAEVVRATTDVTGVHPADIAGAKRSNGAADARSAAVFVSRQVTQLSYAQIGRLIGRGGTAVHMAVVRTYARIEQDEDLAVKIDDIQLRALRYAAERLGVTTQAVQDAVNPEPLTMPGICAVPGCGNRLCESNRSGVCRTHNHQFGYCKCACCAPGGVSRPRIRTRQELIDEGLLRRLPGEKANG